MELISSVNPGGVNSVTFSSIPQTGADLILMVTGRSGDSTTSPFYVEFNGVTTGYTYLTFKTTGSTEQSSSGTTGYIGNLVPSTYTIGTFCNTQTLIPAYTGSLGKTWSSDSVQENNATASDVLSIAGNSTLTAAITSLRVFAGGTTVFHSATIISLYMVTAGTGGATIS